MLSGGRGIDGLDRLDVRLVALLGLALLPIGIIAMVQTYRVIDEVDRKAESALLGATLSAAATERERILRVRGATQFGANLIPLLADDGEECSDYLRSFVEENEAVSFAGYVNSEGVAVCASDGAGSDLAGSEIFQAYQSSRKPMITALTGRITRKSVVVVTEPVRRNDEDLGYLAISVPQQPLPVPPEGDFTPLVSITFTQDGDFLIVQDEDEMAAIAEALPADRSLSALAGSEPVTFEAPSVGGGDRIYTVAPLLPNEIYAMSVWHPSAVRTTGLTAASAILFPLLMWLVSIGVAYFAVHRLVVRHIRHLRMRIRAFTMNRKILSSDHGGDTPSELREVIETFHQMTERIVRDEADLENSLHEKDVLLKEVHHRVKNNLQLISSMINMQLRKSRSEETHLILRRLQDRVLGLATIHRNLYQASVLSRVNSGKLVSDLVAQILRSSNFEERDVDLTLDLRNVALYPDQAVPLSLLVTETITNAVKYAGKDETGKAWISLSLRPEEDDTVILRVKNSTGPESADDRASNSVGLGSQLVAAFVMQLDAKCVISESDRVHSIEVAFKPSDFSEEK